MSKQQELDALVQSIAASGEQLPGLERRNFLKQGLTMLGAAGFVGAASGAADSGTPPNLPAWTKSLGTGVVTNP